MNPRLWMRLLTDRCATGAFMAWRFYVTEPRRRSAWKIGGRCHD